MYAKLKVAVVIPCYRVRDHVLGVIARVPAEVDAIFCVDDACPDDSGGLIQERCSDTRVTVIRNKTNQGVGGAVKAGYRAARERGFDVAVKVDGDGQMDPRLIPLFVGPIADGLCDYAKGNRFYRIEDVRAMPAGRLLGNAVLSFAAKLSTGYWSLFDPTNGYTALHLSTLHLIQIDKVADRYFFETDLLFRLNVARCVVRDIPMAAVYGSEHSNLRILRIVVPFLAGHVRNAFKRILYSYFLRDFQIASLMIVLGPLLVAAGSGFGLYHWLQSIHTAVPATAGTVMIAALLILAGLQLTLSALNYDIQNVPRDPLHPVLTHAAQRTDAAGALPINRSAAPAE